MTPKKITKKKKCKKGMGMVEIVLTIALFTLCIASLLQLFGMTEDVFQKDVSLNSEFQSVENNFFQGVASIENTFQATTSAASVEVVATSSDMQFSELLTDWRDAFGASTCDTSQDGDWTHLSVSGTVELESGNLATALDARGNFVYLTADSATRTAKDFFIIDVSDKNNPRIVSSLDTGPGALSVTVAGNYAYVGNSSVNAQLQIIDIHDPTSPTLNASYKLPGTYSDETTVPISLFYYDSKLYLGTKKSQIAEFHVIDVSDPYHPVELGSYEMNTQVNSIVVKGTLAYVTSPSDNELQVLDVSDPTHITLLSSFNAAGGNGNGKSFFLNGTTSYLGRTKGGSAELYALDTTNPAHISTLGTASIGASINAVIAKGNLVFFITSKQGDNFQVWNVADPANPTRVPNTMVTFSATPTAMDCDQDTFYVALQSSDVLKIITQSR